MDQPVPVTHQQPNNIYTQKIINVHGSMSPTVGHLGKLIYEIESKALVLCFLMTEETKVQCYEHAVVVHTSTSWCNCLNTSYLVETIPRFKIVGCYLSKFRPGRNWAAIFTFIIGWILFIYGLVNGGCEDSGSSRSYYSYYSSSSSNGCGLAVIGGLLVFVVWPNMVFIPLLCFKDWHYMVLESRSGSAGFIGKARTVYNCYRFKGVKPDDYLLIDYVYGALDMAGKDAHVLSHFSEASLATPVVPVCNDNMTDFLRSSQASTVGNAVIRSTKSKNHRSRQVDVAQV